MVAIRRGHLQITGEGRWLVPVAMLFALCVAWRDSAALAALNLLAFVVAASLTAAGPDRPAAARRRLGVRAGRPLRRSAELCRTGTRGGARGRMASGGAREVAASPSPWCAAFCSLPSCFFGALFAAADAVFQTLLSDFFGFDVAEALGHLFLTLVLAWIAAGALWVSLLAQGEITCPCGARTSTRSASARWVLSWACSICFS